MNNLIPRETLIQRIMRDVPENCHVVPVSTPIVSFGNLYEARAVSIGINPSVDEFMSRHIPRRILPEEKKRFLDYETLGLEPGSKITREKAEQVLDASFNYFRVNPYSWFNRMEKYLVNPIGASYFDGSASHLDLVQWATDPVWQNIKDPKISEKLVKDDKEFLFQILSHADYTDILLNGATVVKTVRSLGLFELEEVGRINYGNQSSLLLTGKYKNSLIRATTLNIPSAQGLEGPQKVAAWLEQMD